MKAGNKINSIYYSSLSYWKISKIIGVVLINKMIENKLGLLNIEKYYIEQHSAKIIVDLQALKEINKHLKVS